MPAVGSKSLKHPAYYSVIPQNGEEEKDFETAPLFGNQEEGSNLVSTEGWSSILRRINGSKILMLRGAWLGEEGVKGISGGIEF